MIDPAAHAFALLRAGRVAEAEAACRQAMRARPGQPELLFLLGQILYRAGRRPEAVRALDRAVARRPDLIEAAALAGLLHESLGAYDKAEKSWRQVVAAQPSGPAWFNLGNVLRHLGREAEALNAYRTAHRLAPDDAVILSALVARQQALCDWDGLEDLTVRLSGLVARGRSGVQPFRLLAINCPEEVQGRCARAWGTGLPAAARRPAPPAEPGPVLTLGYLSADYQDHATAYLIAELFELHDRRRFRVMAYSLGPDDRRPMRRRLEAGVDGFRDLSGASASAAAACIRADGVDILVDLKGYTRGARPEILAQRPAPVQVSYLGYPGSMGVDWIDYILADPVVLPLDCQEHYRERIVHLPGCYQVNDRLRPCPAASPDRASLGLPARGPVLACFNAAYKITPSLFAVWMRLLTGAPGAVLWLLADQPAVEANLRAAAVRAGVGEDRLVFAPMRSLSEHLVRYRVADLFLDTLPYNAHTTGSDALWMGCPLVTCRGQSFAGRVGASLLEAVGLPEMVAADLGEYEALAAALLADPARLAALRARLEAGRATAPLFDTPAFARAIETAYETMWQRYLSGQPPAAFAV